MKLFSLSSILSSILFYGEGGGSVNGGDGFAEVG